MFISEIMIDSRFEEDIDLEVGKTYLVYMNLTEGFNKDISFFITGLQYGLREIQISNTKISSDNLRNLRVKNNDNGQWENITETVHVLKER